MLIENNFGDRYYRIYEIQGSSFTATNTAFSDAFLLLDSNAGVDSSVWFFVEGTMLQKFNLSTPPPTLDSSIASGIDGSNFIVSWNSKVGIPYQIQSSVNLTNWVDVGSIITGTGSPMTWANALTNSTGFYRVIEK